MPKQRGSKKGKGQKKTSPAPTESADDNKREAANSAGDAGPGKKAKTEPFQTAEKGKIEPFSRSNPARPPDSKDQLAGCDP